MTARSSNTLSIKTSGLKIVTPIDAIVTGGTGFAIAAGGGLVEADDVSRPM